MNKKILILLVSTMFTKSVYSSEQLESDDEFSAELAEITFTKDQTEERIRATSRAFSSLSLSDETKTILDQAEIKNSGRFSAGTKSIERKEQQEKRKAVQERSAKIHADRAARTTLSIQKDTTPLERKRSLSEPIFHEIDRTKKRTNAASANFDRSLLPLAEETSMEEN